MRLLLLHCMMILLRFILLLLFELLMVLLRYQLLLLDSVRRVSLSIRACSTVVASFRLNGRLSLSFEPPGEFTSVFHNIVLTPSIDQKVNMREQIQRMEGGGEGRTERQHRPAMQRPPCYALPLQNRNSCWRVTATVGTEDATSKQTQPTLPQPRANSHYFHELPSCLNVARNGREHICRRSSKRGVCVCVGLRLSRCNVRRARPCEMRRFGVRSFASHVWNRGSLPLLLYPLQNSAKLQLAQRVPQMVQIRFQIFHRVYRLIWQLNQKGERRAAHVKQRPRHVQALAVASDG